MRNKLLLSLFTLIIAVFFSSIAGADLLDGLIGYWPLDESSGETASDASGSNNVVTLVGDGATWDPAGGKIGGALQLDGTGSAAEDANGASYINGLNAFSVALWIKSAEVNSNKGFMHGKDPSGQDDTFTLRYDSAGFDGKGTNVIKAGITTTGGETSYESASDAQTTEWQHITLTWSSGNQLALYINGTLDEATNNKDAVEGELSGASKFLIGKGGKDANASWNGLIDEVHLYNRVLDDGEITSLASGVNVTSVEARGKLATVWGSLKRQ